MMEVSSTWGEAGKHLTSLYEAVFDVLKIKQNTRKLTLCRVICKPEDLYE
jgi:hypothetical protein